MSGRDTRTSPARLDWCIIGGRSTCLIRFLHPLVVAALLCACGKTSSDNHCNAGPEGFAPCAGEGLICDLNGTCAKPSYTVNGDGTVTDNVTGLLWQQQLSSNPCPSDADGGGCFWSDAQAYCADLSLGGHASGWRVPTVPELFSLGDSSASSGVEETAFPNIGSNILWTSNTITGLYDEAWSVTFVPYDNDLSGGPDVIPQTYTGTPEVNDTLEWVLCVQ